MSGFLYFVPGLQRPANLDDAAAAGVGYAFESKSRLQSAPIHGRTPTGGGGSLLFDMERLGSAAPAYKADEQQWKKVPDTETLVGFYVDDRPTPQTLARSSQLGGAMVRLADGNEWLAPQLKAYSGENGFAANYPLIADMDDDGNWIAGGASPESQRLEKLFDDLMAAMLGEPMKTADALNWAADLLGVNYVIGRREAAMLGILQTDDVLSRILSIATDRETWLDWAQKKSQESSPAESAG